MKRTYILLFILFPFFSFSQAVSDSLIRSVGESIEKSLYENSTDYLTELFSDSIFYSQVLHRDYGNQRLKKLNKSILEENIGFIIGAEVIKVIKGGGYYTFIGFSADRILDEYILLFRLYSESGINYHQYYLVSDSVNTIQFSDVFIFTRGEYFSEILSPIYESKFNKIVEEEGIADAAINQDTSNNKRSIALFMGNIDKYSAAEQYEEALKMIDSVDYYVDDSFLDLYRGNTYLSMGEMEKSLICFKKFQINYPYLVDAYSGLLDNYYQQNKFNQMISLFQALEEKLDVSPQRIHEVIISGYPNLLSQTLYLKWCKKESVDLGTPKVVPLTDFQKEINADYANPEKSPLLKEDLAEFTSLDFFPFDEKYVIMARFVKTENSQPFEMKTTTDRKPIYQTYGVAYFQIDSVSYQLNIYQNQGLLAKEEYKDYLFLPFTDLSNGNESYGGGRFIDLKIPTGDTIKIDFNKAYNPYCAYSHKYSCPIPPVENHLEIEVKAGVKKFHD